MIDAQCQRCARRGSNLRAMFAAVRALSHVVNLIRGVYPGDRPIMLAPTAAGVCAETYINEVIFGALSRTYDRER